MCNEIMCNYMSRSYNDALNTFKSSVSVFVFHYTNKLINSNEENYKSRIRTIHNRKLHNLGYDGVTHPSPETVIFNFSNRILTETEKSALALGLNYCISPSKLRIIDHFTPFEKLAYILTKSTFYNDTELRKSEFNNQLKHIASSSFKELNHNKLSSNMSKEEIEALKNLSKDQNIVIMKPDKGNGTVILNKQDYINKTNEIVSDNAKFKQIDADVFKLVIQLEDKINRFLSKMKKERVITEKD